MPRNLPAAEVAYYGGSKPSGVINADGFRDHDPTKTWDDGGAGRELVEVALQRVASELADHMATYGATQVREAVAEYVVGAYADVALIQGQPTVVIDTSNDAAELRAFWHLPGLIDKAIDEAMDKGDNAFLDAIHTMCERAALKLSAAAQQEPPAPVSRTAPRGRIPQAVRPAAPPPVVRRGAR